MLVATRRPPADPLAAAHLEIEDLREQVATLKSKVGLARDIDAAAAFTLAWGLTRQEATLLVHLHQRSGAVTRHSIMDAMYAESPNDEPDMKIVGVFIWKLRRKLGYDAIDTIWGQGYALAADSRRLCDEVKASPRIIRDRASRFRPAAARRPTDARLRVLRRFADAPTASGSVAAELKLPRSNIHHHVLALVERGLLREDSMRRFPPSGRASLLYALTDAGRDFLEAHAHVDI
jgi:DNA-binding MarR family transcriptional regulator